MVFFFLYVYATRRKRLLLTNTEILQKTHEKYVNLKDGKWIFFHILDIMKIETEKIQEFVL